MATRSWYTIVRDVGGPVTTVVVGGAALFVEGLVAYQTKQLKASVKEDLETRDKNMIGKLADSQNITLAALKIMAAHRRDCVFIESRLAKVVECIEKGGGENC
ncbi:hypothetical protein B9Z19DRAFT_1123338 [Tuber borchii]|uniref:Uncharacterized protein n=1 Tax=Tuber borchii TaxID=42251 RepID=A0A2T6ZYP3_TUBBO|nr:hypothetical protein B9Z19DRAFT_1123338 [Tuber borchii]